MTKKNQPPAEQPTRQWFFPTLGVTVSAATYEEALILVEIQEKDQEAGDVDS